MKKYILLTAFISALFCSFSATAMYRRAYRRAPRTLTELLGVLMDNDPFEEDEFRSQGRDMARKLEVRSDVYSDNNVNNGELWMFSHTEKILTFNPSIGDSAPKYNETIPFIKPRELSIGLDNFVFHIYRSFVDTNKSIGENMKNFLTLNADFSDFNINFLDLLLKKYGTETKKIKL